MTGTISRADIEEAIKGATGNPASGAVADWTPVIAEAIDELINGPAPAKETRIIKAKETRTESNNKTE
jgi:hypothetical protein